MLLTYKYRIKERSAAKRLRQHAFAVNQVWNYCTSCQKDLEQRYRAGAAQRKWPSRFDLQKLTKGTSKELGIHAQTIGSVCQQFAKSRDKARHSLKFRISTGVKRSLGWIPFQQQSRQLDDNSLIYLGKRYRWFGNKRRPLPDTAKGGAFVEDASGRWWVCFHVEVNELPTGKGQIGIDLGLKTLATCSDGIKIPALQHYRKYEQKLAIAQRAGNKRRVKAIHAKIANARRDQIHKATCQIANDNGLIAVGNVSSTKLARTQMAKSVLDASWAMFRIQLRYKASRHGAIYFDIDERFTTQTCSGCGCIAGPRGCAGLNEREWICDGCGVSHDRDVNSAVNILSLALSAQRRGDESRMSA